MDVVDKTALQQHLGAGFSARPDSRRGLSSALIRADMEGELTVAVAGSEPAETRVKALLDLLAWHGQLTHEGRKVTDAVTLVVGAGAQHAGVLEALGTLVSTHDGGPQIRVEQAVMKDGEIEQTEVLLASADFTSSTRAATWAGYLLTWGSAAPGPCALGLIAAVADPRLQLYPRLSSGGTDRWSVRIDGLDIGHVGAVSGELRNPGTAASKVSQTWLSLENPVGPFTDSPTHRLDRRRRSRRLHPS